MACLPIVLMDRFCKFIHNKTVNYDLQTDVGRGGQEQAELANYTHDPLLYLCLKKSGNVICKPGCAIKMPPNAEQNCVKKNPGNL